MRIRAKYDVTDLAPFGGSYVLPRRFDPAVFEPDESDLTHVVEMVVALDAGRFVCEAVTVKRSEGGSPVTSEGLRGVPVAALLRDLALSHLFKVTTTPGGGLRVDPTELPDFRSLAAQGPTNEVLAATALVYRIAYACGDGPTGAVRNAFGIPRPTAARWVARARTAGHLGPTQERRPGEAERRSEG